MRIARPVAHGSLVRKGRPTFCSGPTFCNRRNGFRNSGWCGPQLRAVFRAMRPSIEKRSARLRVAFRAQMRSEMRVRNAGRNAGRKTEMRPKWAEMHQSLRVWVRFGRVSVFRHAFRHVFRFFGPHFGPHFGPQSSPEMRSAMPLRQPRLWGAFPEIPAAIAGRTKPHFGRHFTEDKRWGRVKRWADPSYTSLQKGCRPNELWVFCCPVLSSAS